MRKITLAATLFALLAGMSFAQSNGNSTSSQAASGQSTTTGQAQTQQQTNTSSNANTSNNGTLALPESRSKLGGTEPSARISREVMHELLMNPYYSVFDDLAYRVDGNTVTLLGSVVNNRVKDDAVASIKKIEGVDKVNDQVQVLPTSPMDDQIRRAVYRSVYGADSLSRYAMGAVPSIHIIVKNGHVQLVGVVNTEMDKTQAGMRANGVPNVFSVQNDLQVVPQG